MFIFDCLVDISHRLVRNYGRKASPFNRITDLQVQHGSDSVKRCLEPNESSSFASGIQTE